MKITFDKEQSDERTENGWNWFYGQANIGTEEFDFSLCEMNTNVGGQNTTATEITWVNGTPVNAKEVENKILEVFETTFELQ